MRSTATNRMTRIIDRGSLYNILILSCLGLYEIVSFSSSINTLMAWTGRMDWAILLGFAFVAVDFGGVGKLFVGEDETEGKGNNTLFFAWLITAAMDTYMTYVPISISASARTNHIMVTSGNISVGWFVNGIPWLIALLIWLIQVGLVVALNKIIDRYIRQGKGVTK